MQVTTEGEFVVDMDSVHKKPYEVIMIGRKKGSDADCPREGSVEGCLPACKRQRTDGVSTSDTIPRQKVIMCVPSTIHSQKPFLGGKFKCGNYTV